MEQGFAVDELPDHVGGARRKLGEIVEGGDVRMPDLGREPRFLGEPALGARVVAAERLHHLDDPDLVEVEMPGAIDLAHSSFGDLAENLVLAVDDFAGLEHHDFGAAGGAIPGGRRVRGPALVAHASGFGHEALTGRNHYRYSDERRAERLTHGERERDWRIIGAWTSSW
jgi:hypothetical protein